MAGINLGGNSGCSVQLYTDDNFVRKMSGAASYNSRLKVQCNKQKHFSNAIIRTPRVIGEGMIDGLYYFDMEYVRGHSLADVMCTVDIDDISKIADAICDCVIPYSDKGAGNTQAFIQKISDLSVTLKDSGDIVNIALDMLRLHDWAGMPLSSCHGDFTMENIIVDENGILWLVDFLDSFYDSWCIDMGALLQDAEMFWAYRGANAINIDTAVRLDVFRNLIMDRISRLQNNRLRDVYFVLLLKLVRIYPYAKSDAVIRFLDEKVSAVMEIINGAKWGEKYDACDI